MRGLPDKEMNGAAPKQKINLTVWKQLAEADS